MRTVDKRAAAGKTPLLSPAQSRAATWVLAILVIVSFIGATTVIGIVGDSGAKAVWDGAFN